MHNVHNVDIFGLSETGLDWKQHIPRNKCRQIMDDFWQHARLVTSASSYVQCNLFTAQFSSTCTGVTGRWSGRILDQGMDSHGLGWWSYVWCIHWKNRRKVLLITITAYKACSQGLQFGSIGSKTTYAQQWHLLRQAEDTKPDPSRKRFIKDLDAFLFPHHSSGTEIFLMGDFNETIGGLIRGIDSIVNNIIFSIYSPITTEWTAKLRPFQEDPNVWSTPSAHKNLLNQLCKSGSHPTTLLSRAIVVYSLTCSTFMRSLSMTPAISCLQWYVESRATL